MIREEPFDEIDSGQQFFSVSYEQDYVDNTENLAIYSVNAIANYDKAIIPYLNLLIGTQLERVPGTDKLQIIPGQAVILIRTHSNDNNRFLNNHFWAIIFFAQEVSCPQFWPLDQV